MRRVAVVAGGLAKFGVRQASYRDLIAEAGKACFAQAEDLRPQDIEGFILSSTMPERFAFQTHVAPMGAEILGIRPNRLIQRVENLCASGSCGIRTAYAAIAAGLLDVAMVLGVEKMNMPDPVEGFLHMAAAPDREWDSTQGLSAPAFFALVAKKHMREYGTTEEQLALVSVKNHDNSTHNPYAHFTKPVSLEQVLKGRPISSPLKLLDCSAMTDGAAAIILAAEDRAREMTGKPVFILGTGQAAGGNNLANVPGWTTWPALKTAAAAAYEMAGIKPRDVDVAEVHDCFTISEIIEYEDLGFCEKGKGGAFIAEGKSRPGGEVVVNPSGGLLGRGHPFGATGIAQALEIVAQLRGEAGDRQVLNAKIGLTHNLSGMATEHTILIYGRN
ncbi:MAG: thiolase family protein [Chloroflexota bacterium]|nr:MAG: thiolase family protein [Chloroflexota bacterium]